VICGVSIIVYRQYVVRLRRIEHDDSRIEYISKQIRFLLSQASVAQARRVPKLPDEPYQETTCQAGLAAGRHQ